MRSVCRLGLLCVCSVLLSLVSTSAQSTVILEVVTNQSHDPGTELDPFDIQFMVYANGHEIQGMVFPLILNFSNGNIMGPLSDGSWPDTSFENVFPSGKSVATFASIAWNSTYGQGTDPDTLLYGFTSFAGPWTGSGEVFRIHVIPTDTGTITFEDAGLLPPAGGLGMLDPGGSSLAIDTWNMTVHVPPRPGVVRFRSSAISGTIELFEGSPSRIFFHVDGHEYELAGMTFALRWAFSNGNLVGPISDVSGEVEFSQSVMDAYESIAWNPFYGQGTPEDTTLLGFTSFDGVHFTGSDWVWSVSFTPQDTGIIRIDDSLLVPPATVSGFDAQDPSGASLPSEFIYGYYRVVPCPWDQMGDNNQDGTMTSADLIYHVNYVFKSGPDPLPHRSVGDVNCSGGLGGADIIWLVNYLFKGGAEPCECTMRRI